MPKLSVITVVFNDVKNIRRTLLSVLNQTHPRIEYIIIDGGSTDGTLEIIEEYKGKWAKLISEKDSGIYYAMNKGLAQATGRYVIFMNSGDEFYANDTVEDVFATSKSADIYYGETEMYNQEWKSIGRRRHQAPETFTWLSFKFGMCISHQAIYIKRSLAENYDVNFKYSADIDWIIRAAKKSSNIVNTKMYVAKYLVGGISKKKHLASLKERFQILSKYYGLVQNSINHILMGINLAFYYIRYRRTND